ncbi:MAG: bifunctional glutamate N-acetyltransferase/amino-acid acetyltransferase ArgJ [Blautia sp.]|nr:bifunctional glutamate N-acetyltransferase/amino-acid acetyltransferase ArgJ [Blautia sp.]
MKKIEGGVTAAAGFLAAAVHAGIKEGSAKDDMALVYTKKEAVFAGVFTTNVVKAAPVQWDKKLAEEGKHVHGMIFNSGIANACAGEEGREGNHAMAKAVADTMGTDVEQILTASTGVIGRPLPVDKVRAGARQLCEKLADTREAAHEAAIAIMTTDTVPKECAVEFTVGGKTVRLGGMTKGCGMIHPNMATMLCCVTTDCAISGEMLAKALSEDVKKTFNMISVDRDTSTNDTYIVMANGLAENPVIDSEGEDFDNFCTVLNTVTTELAKKMAGDGEGAKRLLEVVCAGAESHEQAVLISKSVISSNLVKTMVAGSDMNWGRVLCAMGYSGAQFDPERVDLTVKSTAGELVIVKNGLGAGYSETFATEILSQEEVSMTIDLHMGGESATAWGCDLTHEYIDINADYRS